MAQPTATIVERPDVTAALEKSFNGPPVMRGDMNVMREVKFWVYIFNCGPFKHVIARPWAGGGRVTIEPCKAGEEYGKPYVLPDVIQEKTQISGANEFGFVGRDGKFYAQDVLNPDDPMGSWKNMAAIDAGRSTNIGTNLYNFGCFWTLSNPPEKEAVLKAKQRLSEFGNLKITEASALWVAQQDPKYSGERVGFVHHTFADYFGIDTEWHRKYQAKKPCVGCGEMLAENAVVCFKCPATYDWEKAIAAGLRSREQAIAAGHKGK
jgi:hypothetical protein